MKKLIQKWLGIEPDKFDMRESVVDALERVLIDSMNSAQVLQGMEGGEWLESFKLKEASALNHIVQYNVDRMIRPLLAAHKDELLRSEFVDSLIEQINKKQLVK